MKDPGYTRLVKVLVKHADASVDGHRGYPIAVRRGSNMTEFIVVAATESVGFVWGRLYRVKELNPKHHPYVLEEVTRVPHDAEWDLFEALVDEKAGHGDVA